MSVSSDQRMKGQGNHGNNGDYNAWGGSVNQGGNQYHSRKGHGYDDYNNYNNSNRGGGYHGVNDGGVKHVERGMQGLGLGGHHDRNAPNNSHSGGRQEQQQKDAPRKMTWATIASQPAKPTVTQTSTILKKKGPGMPPPPMVPGRHNMDIGTWDSPSKNGPPLVPPTFNSEPPQSAPPISASFSEEPQPNRQANGSGGSGKGAGPAWPTPGQAMSAQQPPLSQPPQHQQHQQQQPQQQPPPPQENHRRPERQNMSNYNHHDSGSMNQNHAGGYKSGQSHPMQPPSHQHHSNSYMTQPSSFTHSAPPPPVEDTTEALNRLLDMSKYNPANYEIENVDLARFFVIKSYSEDDIHRSIKYNIWCSTEHGNKRLDQAFHEREKEGGAVYLFYSVNGSGHFCGMAQMISPVDYSSNSSVWAQDKWKGSFKVRWVYVKDVPNPQLRHIRLENNENKPVTNSRDTQEVPNARGQLVWRIIHAYKHSTSLFDDFVHYEQRQQEESTRRVEPGAPGGPSPHSHSYRSGSPQYDNKYPQDRSGDRGGNGRYGETNNNSRDMGSSSGGQYERGYQSNDSKYGGYNNRNNYGNSGFDRNNYQSGSGGSSSSYNNRSYGYRRDEQGGRGGNGDGESGTSPGSYHSRSAGNNYRGNNRGGFNNDYYNNRRQDNRVSFAYS